MNSVQLHSATKKTLRIKNGQVECPLRGLVDVESCFYCAHMVSVDLDSSNPTVTCYAKDDVSERERRAHKWVSLLQLAD